MAQVVLDSGNLDAVVRDATGEGIEPVELPTSSGPLNQAAADAAATEAKAKAETEKPETEKEVEAKTDGDDPDDVEGPDGLTPREKRELTAKMQKAIGKRTLALREAEAFAADQYNARRLAEQRAEQYEREINRFKAQLEGEKPAPVNADAQPDRAAFKSDEEYANALIDWRVEQRLKAREAEQQKARAEQVLEAAKSRIARALEIVPDYREVTESADFIVPAQVAGLMQESELFAELGYHFAQHPEDLGRLAVLPPQKLTLEFRKIEGTLQPFAPSSNGAAKTNGDKPSRANGAKPSTETGESQSTETGTTPSKPRAAAPITPLSSVTGTLVERPVNERTLADEKAAFQKRAGVNFSRRQRH